MFTFSFILLKPTQTFKTSRFSKNYNKTFFLFSISRVVRNRGRELCVCSVCRRARVQIQPETSNIFSRQFSEGNSKPPRVFCLVEPVKSRPFRTGVKLYILYLRHTIKRRTPQTYVEGSRMLEFGTTQEEEDFPSYQFFFYDIKPQKWLQT